MIYALIFDITATYCAEHLPKQTETVSEYVERLKAANVNVDVHPLDVFEEYLNNGIIDFDHEWERIKFIDIGDE